jgi:tetratricopeptide repeat protein
MAENPRIEELRRRVEADPASIAFAALAEEFRRVGRFEDAVATCRTGLQRHPAYLSARVTLGRALIETGDYDGAREELETVLRSAPENLAALRGLDQIHDRLGHSAEMDPHLAEMMRTMHLESIRVAAEPPPLPVPVALTSAATPSDSEPEIQTAPIAAIAPELGLAPGPESSFALEPELSPAPEPEAPFSMGPETAAAAEIDAPVDVFASFARASAAAPAHDFSFDLSTAFSIQPTPGRPADVPVDFLAAAPTGEPPAPLVLERFAEPLVPVFVPPFEASMETDPESRFDAGPDPEDVFEAGPDPEVLATLARLERFLGAIHSLRV